jgi:methylenetetrahydrofolate reductase (NADPH)
MNKLTEAFDSGRLILTASFFPPRGSDAEAVRSIASVLPLRLDAVVVADNPDQIRSSAFSAAYILHKENGMSVILSMSTRDRNRIGLLSDALGAAALGIDGILCVSGRHQSLGLCAQAAAANDMDSVQFAQVMKRLILHGAGMDGKEMVPRLDLQIGAAAQPFMQPLDLSLLRLKKKITVGADFLMTQAVFDLDGFVRWMEAVRATGLDKRTAIIPSVLLLTSVEGARELQRSQAYGPIGDDIIARLSRASNAAREGVAIASEIASRLKDMPGIRGIHIFCGGCEALAADVIKQAGI